MGMSLSFAVLINILIRSIGNSLDPLLYPFSLNLLPMIIAIVPLLTFLMLFVSLLLEIICNLKYRKNKREEQQPYMEICRDLILDCRTKEKLDSRNYERTPFFSLKRVEVFFYGIYVVFISCSIVMMILLFVFTLSNTSALSRTLDSSYFGFTLAIIVLLSFYIVVSIIRWGVNVFPEFRIIAGVFLNLVLMIIVPYIGISSVNYILMK
jgi:hypothetical protein